MISDPIRRLGETGYAPPGPLRLTIGVDPGIKGAIMVLGDGEPIACIDMPTRSREPTKAGKSRGYEVDAGVLASRIRGIRQQHQGVHVMACLEHIAMRDTNARGTDQKAGEGYGIVKGVLGALSIPWVEVYAQTWKRHFGLLGTEKDTARLYAMRLFPRHQQWLARKSDNGRADGLLIGRWAWDTEQHAEVA